MLNFIRGIFTPSIGEVLAAFQKVESALDRLIQHHNEVQNASLIRVEKLTQKANASAATIEHAKRVKSRVQEFTS